MNQREKFLLYAVGGLLLAVGLQYGLSSFQSGLKLRRTSLHNAENKLSNYQEEEYAGLLAEQQIGDYRRRSLPSDTQAAQSQYKAWLEQLVRESGLTNTAIDYVGDQGSNKLYRIYTFRLAGQGNIQHVSEVLADFHRKNYLQRVKKLSLRPVNEGNQLQMGLDVEAIALLDAAVDQPPPESEDPRIAGRDQLLVKTIIERNMFAPPNRAPEYQGEKTLAASIGTDFRSRLKFNDPDSSDRLDYEVVGQLPAGMQFDQGELVGRPQAKGDFEFTVRAWDNGLPSRQLLQTLSLHVGDPPPPPPEPEKPPAFDDSQQAMLTGLVHSRGQWNVWINVRTQNKLLKLKVGDEFQVGSVSGKIIEITDRFAVFESDGKRYTIDHDSSLANARAPDGSKPEMPEPKETASTTEPAGGGEKAAPSTAAPTAPEPKETTTASESDGGEKTPEAQSVSPSAAQGETQQPSSPTQTNKDTSPSDTSP